MANMDSKVFYKYRPANDFTIALLEKQEMKFSLSEEYSDPFDSKLIINVDSDTDLILQRLEDTPIDESKKQSLRKRIKSGEITNSEYLQVAYKAAERTIMSSCFAGSPDNLLLWSHYADKHKGLCVGIRDCSSTDISAMKFDVEGYCTSLNDPHFSGLFPVYKINYSDDGIVEWKLFNDDIKTFIDAHRNKANCWKYEDEYRVIVPQGSFTSQILPFDNRFLVEVYFGCCIDSSFRSKAIEIIKARYLKKGIMVRVFQMVRSKKLFVLEKKEISI
jgi:Protein of unknown function (DUF2971)